MLSRYHGGDTEYCVPEGTESIADLEFAGSNELERLYIPESVNSIGNYAFMNCYCLQEIKMPERVSHIGTGLFQNCWKLREIAFPEGLEMLGGEMIESCHALRTVYLPDTLEHVERTAFNTCRSLRYIHISPDRMHVLPASIRNIAVLTYMGIHGGSSERSEYGSHHGLAETDSSLLVDEYARRRPRLLLDLAINRRDVNAVRYMLDHKITDADAIGDYLNKSAETGRVEITALLLDYTRDSLEIVKDPVLSTDPFE